MFQLQLSRIILGFPSLLVLLFLPSALLPIYRLGSEPKKVPNNLRKIGRSADLAYGCSNLGQSTLPRWQFMEMPQVGLAEMFFTQKKLITAMLAVVFNLYCPLINRTGLKVVFMFVKDTIWSLFFLKSPEKSIIQLKISQNPTSKLCVHSTC